MMNVGAKVSTIGYEIGVILYNSVLRQQDLPCVFFKKH